MSNLSKILSGPIIRSRNLWHSEEGENTLAVELSGATSIQREKLATAK